MGLIKIKVSEKSPNSGYKRMAGRERFFIKKLTMLAKSGPRGKQIALDNLTRKIDWCSKNMKMNPLIVALKRNMKNTNKIKISAGTLRNASENTLKKIISNLA